MTSESRAVEIFGRALEVSTGERSEFVAAECAGDADLRRRVDELLESCRHVEEEGFLGRPLFPTGLDGTPVDPRAKEDEQFVENRPDQVGRYLIREHLGSGGEGIVFRALDSRLGREVALKFLRPSLAQDPKRREAFENEARTLAKLRTPSLCVLLDSSWDAAPPYHVLELADGENLGEQLRRKSFDPRETIGIARQLVDALQALHSSGKAHRDLKPGNIVLDTSHRLKLIDFGTSVESLPTAADQAGVMGTPGYMSPEHERGEPTNGSTDLWALGVVLFELLTREKPHSSSQGDKSDGPNHSIRLDKLPEQTPSDLVRLIERLLQEDPGERPSLPHVIEGLEDAAQSLDVEPKVNRFCAHLSDLAEIRALNEDKLIVLVGVLCGADFSLEEERPADRFRQIFDRLGLEADGLGGLLKRASKLDQAVRDGIVARAIERDFESFADGAALVSAGSSEAALLRTLIRNAESGRDSGAKMVKVLHLLHERKKHEMPWLAVLDRLLPRYSSVLAPFKAAVRQARTADGKPTSLLSHAIDLHKDGRQSEALAVLRNLKKNYDGRTEVETDFATDWETVKFYADYAAALAELKDPGYLESSSFAVQRFRELRSKHHERVNGNFEVTNGMACCLYTLSRSQFQTDDLDEAAENAMEAIGTFRTLGESADTERRQVQVTSNLASALLLLGNIKTKIGNLDRANRRPYRRTFEAARQIYEEARGIRSALSGAKPENQVFQSHVAQCDSMLGNVMIVLGNTKEAVAIARKSLEQRESDHARNRASDLSGSADTKADPQYTASLKNYAAALYHDGSLTEAAKYQATMILERRKLVINQASREVLVEDLVKHAEILLQIGEEEEAYRVSEEAALLVGSSATVADTVAIDRACATLVRGVAMERLGMSSIDVHSLEGALSALLVPAATALLDRQSLVAASVRFAMERCRDDQAMLRRKGEQVLARIDFKA